MDTPPPTPPSPSDADATPDGKQTPEKYIRTYAGDMEILKKGGIPDLKPLTPPQAAPTISLGPLPPPTPIPAPPPAPIPMPIPVKAPPPVRAPAPPPALELKPQPPPPQPKPLEQPPEPLHLERKPSPLQTYAGDFSQRMEETHASTATVLAAEQDAASGEPAVASENTSRKNIIPIVAGIVLLIVGGAGAYIAYTRYLVKVQPVVLAPVVSTPIFVDEREKISGETPAAVLQAIEQSVTRSLAPNTVRLLYTEMGTTTANSVFSSLRLPAPGVLLRNVNTAESMAGVVNVDGTQSPFFILSVATYGDTFAGMLSWEPTITRDLKTLFPPYPQSVQIVSTSSLQTSTTTTPGAVSRATSTMPVPVFVLFFHDEVVSNHDTRVYRDVAGRSILMYGYWNQTTLVIARDPAAFSEILERLATSRAQ